jgi:hypothetical protein
MDPAPNRKRSSDNSWGVAGSFVGPQPELVVGRLQQSWPWEAGTHPFRHGEAGEGRNLRSVRTVVATGPDIALVVAVDGKRFVVDSLLHAPEAACGYTAFAEGVETVANDYETKSSRHD